MIVITARNVNEALPLALNKLADVQVLRSSRNGTVLAFPQPVTTVYLKPTERVLFSTVRNANPAFHLLESLWMLAGRKDVAFPSALVKNMKSFTDDGKSFWGAYGHRWRNFFGWDQIEASITELKNNPESRRVVIGMWNAMEQNTRASFEVEVPPDFIVGQRGGLDVPCNTHIYLDVRDGKLNMTVCCRSNDVLWGCYGANVVHMSMLQEYIALSVGVPVGVYNQISNDLHVYSAKIPEQGLAMMSVDASLTDCYSKNYVQPTPLWRADETKLDFDEDLEEFFRAFDKGGLNACLEIQYETQFFQFTVVPMLRSWLFRKTTEAALIASEKIEALDWGWVMRSWLVKNAPKKVSA